MTTTEIPTATPLYRLVSTVDGMGEQCCDNPVTCCAYFDDLTVDCCGECLPAALREHADSWQRIVVETVDPTLRSAA